MKKSCFGQTNFRKEMLVVQLPCCDSAQIMSRLRRDSGGTWSISSIFWTRTIGELRSDEDGDNHIGGMEIKNTKCLNEFKTCVGGNAGFAISLRELASKPATVLTALFASLGLPIEFVPRAIRKARELQAPKS